MKKNKSYGSSWHIAYCYVWAMYELNMLPDCYIDTIYEKYTSITTEDDINGL